MSKWYSKPGPQGDIAVSSRIRLARNVAELPFPGLMTREQQQRLIDEAAKILCADGGYELRDLSELDKLERTAMVERHLISPELAGGSGLRGVLLSADESVSVMINEEDHFRIQVIGSGICLKECMEKAESVDNLLEKHLNFAFDDDLGYLTHCPTNLGTGLRASVMLHLPFLTDTGNIRGIINSVPKLGFAIRGFYGEGSEAKGSLYQISNQLTLGVEESEAISLLSDAVTNIISHEQRLRDKMLSSNPLALEDRVWRAVGTLATSRLLSADEAMGLLSSLRVGVAMGIIQNIDILTINSLLWKIQPASLALASTAGMSTGVRDIKRAKLVRESTKPLLCN